MSLIGSVYDVGDILDKTLWAQKTVPVLRSPNDSAVPFGEVHAGNPIGVVFSYLEASPAANRSNLYWMFMEPGYNGKPYYVKHEPNAFDLQALRDQGIISIKEKEEQEKQANRPWYDQLIHEYGPPLLLAGAGIAIVTAWIKRPRS